MWRNTGGRMILFQNPAGLRMIPKPGRVPERNPITMECGMHVIRIITDRQRNRGKRPRNTRTLRRSQVSKIKNTNKSCSLQ